MTTTTPSPYALAILGALQKRPVYMGTVPAQVVERRRARARVARKSRRINRS